MRTISPAVRDTEPCRLIGYYLCRGIRIGNLNEHIPTYVPTPAVAILPTNPGRKSLMQVMMTPGIMDKVCTLEAETAFTKHRIFVARRTKRFFPVLVTFATIRYM